MIAPPVQRGNQGELLLARKCLMRSGGQNGWITPWIPTGRRILGIALQDVLVPGFLRQPDRNGVHESGPLVVAVRKVLSGGFRSFRWRWLVLLVRWWRRRAFIRQLRMNRITVDELRG